jgi:acyl-CoA thioesterase
MTSPKLAYSALIGSLREDPSGLWHMHIPAGWLQGRTTYGGLSAALCHEAGKTLGRDMPLRSAQIAFVGPAGGDVSLQAETLRAGKSSTYVGVDLIGEKGLATRAIFVFGSARPEGKTMASGLVAPKVAAPDTSNQMFPDHVGPVFMSNFDIELISGGLPMSGSDDPENLYWMRHRDRAAPPNVTSLLALGDAPPPVGLSFHDGPLRISSMNWSIDILTDRFDTEDHWWLSRAQAETLGDGYSAQSMTLWNRHGRPVMASRQTIAIFG